MGIQDRDYMKRPSDDDADRRGSSSDSKLEDAISGFLRRNPRFFLYVGLGVGALVIAAIVVIKSQKGS